MTMNRKLRICALAPLSLAAALPSASQERPNVVLIMLDDVGYSDFGCFGGEIPTPNIDRIAAQGVSYTQFYNCGRSCPTRASLLTGLYPHQTGIGEMSEGPRTGIKPDNGHPSYMYYINRNCVTMAEMLRSAGYQTWISGKWHLGMHGEDKMPLQRGFDKFYGILAGITSYLRPHGGWSLWEGNEMLPEPEPPYYTTDAFASKAIEYIEGRDPDSPFFLYLAFNAAHWPLQAKQEDIDRFRGAYDAGWETVREARYARMLEKGLVRPEWGLSEWENRSWDDLAEEEKADRAGRMEVYAAQIFCADYNIGRVLDCLDREGLGDNTLVFFLSDNGASSEPFSESGYGTLADVNNPENLSKPSYGQPWAQVSNTPFRKYKIWSYEGGISTPLFVSWPARFASKAGQRRDAVAFLPDIMATVSEATGAQYPSEFGGNSIYPLEGRSLLDNMEHPSHRVHKVIFGEHFNNRYVRTRRWKAVWEQNTCRWELYDMKHDRTERYDLSEKYPGRTARLAGKWNVWAESHGVWPKRVPKPKKKK